MKKNNRKYVIVQHTGVTCHCEERQRQSNLSAILYRSRLLRRSLRSLLAMTGHHLRAELLRKYLFISMLFFFVLVVSLCAEEEQGTEETKVEKKRVIKYERVTKIDFNELLLTGELKRPSGFVILKRANVKFQGLIKLKKDFDRELDDSLLIIGY